MASASPRRGDYFLGACGGRPIGGGGVEQPQARDERGDRVADEVGAHVRARGRRAYAAVERDGAVEPAVAGRVRQRLHEALALEPGVAIARGALRVAAFE